MSPNNVYVCALSWRWCPVGTYGPFLLLLPPKTLAVIAMHTTVNTLVREGNHGVPLTRVLYQIGAAVQVEVRLALSHLRAPLTCCPSSSDALCLGCRWTTSG